jgi:hypothetical protein
MAWAGFWLGDELREFKRDGWAPCLLATPPWGQLRYLHYVLFRKAPRQSPSVSKRSDRLGGSRLDEEQLLVHDALRRDTRLVLLFDFQQVAKVRYYTWG